MKCSIIRKNRLFEQYPAAIVLDNHTVKWVAYVKEIKNESTVLYIARFLFLINNFYSCTNILLVRFLLPDTAKISFKFRQAKIP